MVSSLGACSFRFRISRCPGRAPLRTVFFLKATAQHDAQHCSPAWFLKSTIGNNLNHFGRVLESSMPNSNFDLNHRGIGTKRLHECMHAYNNKFKPLRACAKLILGIAGENSRSIHANGLGRRLTRPQEPRDDPGP